jgi:hypothetical protein
VGARRRSQREEAAQRRARAQRARQAEVEAKASEAEAEADKRLDALHEQLVRQGRLRWGEGEEGLAACAVPPSGCVAVDCILLVVC